MKSFLSTMHIVAFVMTGCGGESVSEGSESRRIENPQPSLNSNDVQPSNPSLPMNITIDECKAKLREQDTDNDQIKDFDEVYGRTVFVLGQQVNVYTNPKSADTDGDGQSDFFESQGLNLWTKHPAHRDYQVKVFARGGLNNEEYPNASWNSWQDQVDLQKNIRVRTNDRLFVKHVDGTLSGGSRFRSTDYALFPPPQFGGTPIPALDRWVTARGYEAPYQSFLACERVFGVMECIPSMTLNQATQNYVITENYGSLIGKYARSLTTESTTSTEPFSIGFRMNQDFEWRSAETVPASLNDFALFLGANEGYQARQSQNEGWLHIYVRFENPSDYSQVPPVGTREIEILKSLCPQLAP